MMGRTLTRLALAALLGLALALDSVWAREAQAPAQVASQDPGGGGGTVGG